MRFSILFILFFFSIIVSCNNDKSEVKQEETQISVEYNAKRALREKVYETLMEEQQVYDSLSLAGGVIKDTLDCGTRLTPDQYDEISNFFDNVCTPELVPDDTTTILTYPMQFYIVCKKNNNGSATKVEIKTAFTDLQAKYKPAGVAFSLAGIDTIQADNFYNLDAMNDFMILRRRKDKAITIFIFNSIKAQNQPVNGYAKMERGADFVMLTGDAIRNKTTFPHELGHYFLLYHTHGKTNNGSTDELVDGGSCSCTGDDVCDTPADPNLLNDTIKNCVYAGTRHDIDGELFKPDPTNLMCYATNCRKSFTHGQYQRIRWAALKYRNYFRELF